MEIKINENNINKYYDPVTNEWIENKPEMDAEKNKKIKKQDNLTRISKNSPFSIRWRWIAKKLKNGY